MLYSYIYVFSSKHHVSRQICKMFHIFTHYILGCNVSRETLSCIIFLYMDRMFHVKHSIHKYLYIVIK